MYHACYSKVLLLVVVVVVAVEVSCCYCGYVSQQLHKYSTTQYQWTIGSVLTDSISRLTQSSSIWAQILTVAAIF